MIDPAQQALQYLLDQDAQSPWLPVFNQSRFIVLRRILHHFVYPACPGTTVIWSGATDEHGNRLDEVHCYGFRFQDDRFIGVWGEPSPHAAERRMAREHLGGQPCHSLEPWEFETPLDGDNEDGFAHIHTPALDRAAAHGIALLQGWLIAAATPQSDLAAARRL